MSQDANNRYRREPNNLIGFKSPPTNFRIEFRCNLSRQFGGVNCLFEPRTQYPLQRRRFVTGAAALSPATFRQPAFLRIARLTGFWV